VKVLHRGNDGGRDSTVWGFWLIEAKRLFSVVLLRFAPGTRDAHHSHAFNCISWVLRGKLVERHLNGTTQIHRPSWKPVMTYRDTFHQVESVGVTWVFSLRGPWAKTWQEHTKTEGVYTLQSGRVRV
jgi:hypothetical protein